MIKSILLFNSGAIAVCDEGGNQIPELQKNLLVMWAETASEKGFNPENVKIETQSGLELRLVRSDGDWYIDTMRS